jgi:hypothetical protein
MSEGEAQGEGFSPELVRNPAVVTGIERVFPVEQLSSTLSGLSLQTDVFYTMFRPEDTVLITENGYENLSEGIPRSVAEIEAFIKEK